MDVPQRPPRVRGVIAAVVEARRAVLAVEAEVVVVGQGHVPFVVEWKLMSDVMRS